jgi:hypothetical protein
LSKWSEFEELPDLMAKYHKIKKDRNKTINLLEEKKEKLR